jgi:predicted O-methyltransferase YrrM
MSIIKKIKKHGITKSFLFGLKLINKNNKNIINKIIAKKILSENKFKTEEDYLKFSYEYLDLMQEKYEIKELLKIVKNKKPKIILEIGSARGGTLFLFSKYASKNATIISVDLPGGEFGGGYSKSRIPIFEKFIEKEQKIELIRNNSHLKNTKNKVLEILKNKKIDFLFIDGDHTYKGVKTDFNLYSQLVSKGGIIALHDIAKHPKETNCQVDKFWNEIKKKHPHKEIILDKNQGWAGIGVIFK